MRKRWWIPTRREAACAFGVAMVLLVLVDSFVVESVVIPTESMVPTILPDERAWLLKVGTGEIRRLDVVVVREPKRGTRLAKRVIGLPGEHVRVSGPWEVSIDGRPLPPPPGHEGPTTAPEVSAPAVQEFALGPDEYFVMGDNRTDSLDSRSFGAVKRSAFEGRLWAVWYSFDRIGHGVRWKRLFASIH